MAAEYKIFTDAGCTEELTVVGDHYTLQIGETTGINGSDGASEVKQLWVKNTGTILMSNIVLTEVLDTPVRGSYSLDNITYNPTTITLGNLIVNAIVTFYAKITVAPSTSTGTGEVINFQLSGTHLNL